MRIGIDGNEANVKRRVGIGEYAYQLLEQFSRLQNEYGFTASIYLKSKPLPVLPVERSNWHYTVCGPQKLWTQFGLPLHLYTRRPRPEVFFTPSHYAPRFSPVPTVISIMDISYLHFPELFNPSDLYQLKNWTAYSVKNAKRVFTISEASKNDIIKEYGIIPERVVVLYPGIKPMATLAPHVFPMQDLKQKYQLGTEYILYVGTLQPRKNLVRLIEAFAKIIRHKNHQDLQLVLVGKKGWLYEDILTAPQKYGVAENVKFLDFVTNDDLPLLYQHAVCFAWPSLYEGFGLPILEAMQHGCPVLTSNVSSLPEAGGEAALYVDPQNVDDIAAKLLQLLDNESLRKDLREKGKKQVKKFNWERSARVALNVLEEVGKAGKHA